MFGFSKNDFTINSINFLYGSVWGLYFIVFGIFHNIVILWILGILMVLLSLICLDCHFKNWYSLSTIWKIWIKKYENQILLINIFDDRLYEKYKNTKYEFDKSIENIDGKEHQYNFPFYVRRIGNIIVDLMMEKLENNHEKEKETSCFETEA